MALKISKTGQKKIRTERFEDTPIFRESKKQVVQEIDEVLVLLKLNRSWLAKALDIQPSAVTQSLKPTKGMQLTTLVRMADMLGCDVEINLILRHSVEQPT